MPQLDPKYLVHPFGKPLDYSQPDMVELPVGGPSISETARMMGITEDTGLSLTPEQLDKAAEAPAPAGIATNPFAQAGKVVNPFTGLDALRSAAEVKAYAPKTAEELVTNLAASRGITVGDALQEYGKLYDAGIGEITSLKGAKELREATPGRLSRLLRSTVESAVSMPANLGSFLPGEIGKQLEEESKYIEESKQTGVSGAFTPETLGNVAGWMLDAAVIEPLAVGIVGAIVPRLPWVAKAVGGITDAVKVGRPVSEGMLDVATSALARAGKTQKFLGTMATFVGTDVARGDSLENSLVTNALTLGALGGLKGIAKFAARSRLGTALGLGKKADDIAVRYLMGVSGKTKLEIGALQNTTGKMLDMLNDAQAPAAVKQQIFQASTMDEAENMVSQYYGAKMASWQLKPAEVEDWIAGAPKLKREQVLDAYNQFLGNWRTGMPAEARSKLNVVAVPVQRGGVDVYFPPLSQWARSAARLRGTVDVVEKQFDNPYVVHYSPADMALGKTPAEVVVDRLAAGHPEGAKALEILNSAGMPSESAAWNNLSLEIAGRLARDKGYGAIHVVGPTVSEDFVADLSRLGKVDFDAIKAGLEERIRAGAEESIKGIPIEEFEEGSAGVAKVKIPLSPLASERAAPRPEEPIFPSLFRRNQARDLANINRLKAKLEAALPADTEFVKKDLSVAVRSYVRDFPKAGNPLEAIEGRLTPIRGKVPRGGVGGDTWPERSFITLINPKGLATTSVRGIDAEVVHEDLLKRAIAEMPTAERLSTDLPYLSVALDEGWIRGGRTSAGYAQGPFVEFNYDAPQAAKRAAEFITNNFRTGDEISLDIHKGGKLYSAMGIKDLNQALKYIDAGEIIREKKFATSMRDFLAIPAAVGFGEAVRQAYDLFSPAPAEASIWSELGKKAAEAAGETFIERGAKAAAEEDLATIAKKAMEGQAAKVVVKAAAGEYTNDIAGEALDHFTVNVPTTPEARGFLGMLQMNYGLKSAAGVRNVIDLSDHPFWKQFWARFADSKDLDLTSRHSIQNQFRDTAEEIFNEGGITGDVPEFRRAFEGLRMGVNGVVRQTLSDVEPKLAKAVSDMRTRVVDPMFEQVKGVTVQAHSIAGKYKLPDEPQTWRDLRELQDMNYDPAGTLQQQFFKSGRRPNVNEVAAAEQTRGMLNFGPTNDLSVKYNEGRFSMIPIENERARLVEELSKIKEAHPEPSTMPTDMALNYANWKTRLDDLDRMEIKARNAAPPNMQVLQGKQWTTALDPAQFNIPELSVEQDPRRVMHSYIGGLSNKIFWDKELAAGKNLAALFTTGEAGPGLEAWRTTPNPALAAKLVTSLNLMRGLRTVTGNQGVANVVNNLFHAAGLDKRVGVLEAQGWIRNWLNFNYITKVALNPAFPIQNAAQPAMTTSIVTGWKHLLGAYAKVWGDRAAAFAEADAAGVTKYESGYTQELAGGEEGVRKYLTPIERALDYLPSRTENMNRVVTYHAAKSQALELLAKGEFKVPVYVDWFDSTILKGGTDAEIAAAYGKAVTRTTQFMFGPEGKPTALIGGPFRQMMGQFKSFQSGYATLVKNVVKHTIQTKDPVPIARMLGSLMVFGGVAAVPGAATIYEIARHEMLKQGYNLPPGSGVGVMYDWLSQTQPLAQMPEVTSALDAIQAGGKFSPLNLPSGDHVLSWLLGPTFGSMFDIGADVFSGQRTKAQVAASALRNIGGPTAGAIPELLQNTGVVNDLGIGYRGGAYSPGGNPLVDRQTAWDTIARAMNLQRTKREQKYEFMKDLTAALEGGQMDMARQIMDKAARYHVPITSQDISTTMGAITRQRNLSRPNQ